MPETPPNRHQYRMTPLARSQSTFSSGPMPVNLLVTMRWRRRGASAQDRHRQL